MSLLSDFAFTRRNTFFSFHYDDIFRVNAVRRSGEFKNSCRDIEGYYDWSLWESAKTTGPESLKSLIRAGMKRSSVVCVLVGSETWGRPWVRYEIARSVIDGLGLLAVNINSVPDINPPYGVRTSGTNPCMMMGVGRRENRLYLYEIKWKPTGFFWTPYADYTQAVPCPRYLRPPSEGQISILGQSTPFYEWMPLGHAHIGRWLDEAAVAAGR